MIGGNYLKEISRSSAVKKIDYVRLFARDFYNVTIDSAFRIINYHLIPMSSS